MDKLVEVSNATFGYGAGKSFISIVSDISLSVSTGQFILLIGPNGCGKSTIIRGLFNLVACSEGTIAWHIPRNEIGYIPQESNIDHDIPATALDVVCTSQPFYWTVKRKHGMEMLAKVGMQRYAKDRFGTLSGGQKRRVLLARALFGNPRFLVLDEPTVNTDAETGRNVENILMQLCGKGEVGILATTHSEHWAPAATRRHLEGGRLDT
jgi:ABC-type Mn2+/Zn2+ transport system ATPase subunit